MHDERGEDPAPGDAYAGEGPLARASGRAVIATREQPLLEGCRRGYDDAVYWTSARSKEPSGSRKARELPLDDAAPSECRLGNPPRRAATWKQRQQRKWRLGDRRSQLARGGRSAGRDACADDAAGGDGVDGRRGRRRAGPAAAENAVDPTALPLANGAVPAPKTATMPLLFPSANGVIPPAAASSAAAKDKPEPAPVASAEVKPDPKPAATEAPAAPPNDVK